MQQITYITVDVGRVDSLPPIIPAKQGDTGRYVQATVTDKGVPFNPSGAIAVARIRKPDGTACVYDEGISISGGVVIFPLVAQALTAAGRARGEISLYTSAADRITTFDFWLDIEKNAVADAEIVSSDYYNILTAQIAQILSSNTIVKPLGYYATLTALEAGVPSPNPGDMYAVGTAAPYDYYVWDGVGQRWVNNGPLEGAPGTPGATFTPIVYSDGVLAWTNDAGLDNPEPVNITGPVGPPGTGLDILGYYVTLEALMTDVIAPAAGDTYGVGLAAPYDIYVWDGVGQRWVNNGQIEGVRGVTFTPSVAADGTLSWINDGGLENPAPVNIKGATGPTGPAGPNRITADTDTDLGGVLVGKEGNVTAYTADAAREYIGAASNLNLLYNCDFRNPVNQRGLESYACSTTWTYTIDRWRGMNMDVSVTDGGLNIIADDSNAGYKRFQQVLGRKLKAGITVTASIAIESLTATDGVVFCLVNGTSRFAIKTIGNISSPTIVTTSYTLTNDVDLPGIELMTLSGTDKGWSAVITAAKLEIGPISTLATDLPADRVTETKNCQSYYKRYGANTNLLGTYMTATYIRGIFLFEKMNKTPTGSFSAQYYFNSTWKDIETLSLLINGDSVLVSATIPDASTPGMAIMMRITEGYLDAEIY